MQVTVQRLSPVLVEFDIVIDADRVHLEMDKAFQTVARTARVPGFRPGKAPRRILSHRFGPRVARDVAQRLVDDTFPKAVTEQRLQPVSTPDFEPQKLVDNQPFGYKARFEVLPQIESVSYEGLTAKRPKIVVEDSAVDTEIQNLRRAHSTLQGLSAERPTELGDVLTIDFEVSVGGAVVEDAGTKGFQAELGGGSLIPQIEKALLGRKVGDLVDVELALPAEHPHPTLRGQQAAFRVTLRDQKVRTLPEADDEFAKDLGDFDTLDALRKNIRQKLEAARKEETENVVAEQLVHDLVRKNDIPVPPSLVERQIRMSEQEILTRARSQGQKVTGLGPELKQKLKADSELKVRAGLLMAEIARRESIKIGEAEMEEGIKELATQSGKAVAKVRAEYADPRRREVLMGMILENKVLDIIETKATIEEE